MNKNEKEFHDYILLKVKEIYKLLSERKEIEIKLERIEELLTEKTFAEMNTKQRGELDNFFGKIREIIEERDILRNELKIAEKIQEALLPDKPPEIEGFDIEAYFKAARVVSGDYFDFIPITTNMYGITVADVSGKGLPGSLIMSMARSVLRLQSQQNPFPGLVLREVSKVLLKDLLPGVFITIVYVILNTLSKTVSIASAGHNPVLFFNAKNNEIHQIKPGGVGIGVGDELFFEKYLFEEKITMKKDDILFLYTDGLTECMNIKEEQFGLNTVISLLHENSKQSSKEIVKVILSKVEEFRGTAPQNDDITILCLKSK